MMKTSLPGGNAASLLLVNIFSLFTVQKFWGCLKSKSPFALSPDPAMRAQDSGRAGVIFFTF